MTRAPGATLHVQVIGSGPAAPQPDTPASGLLVASGEDSLLIDCGAGSISRLRRYLEPTTLSAVLVTHFHADHYIDLIALRYLLPWEGLAAGRFPVFLPKGGAERLRSLAGAIDERPTFFDEAFEVREFGTGDDIGLGGLRLTFHEAQHYVPAWSVRVTDPSGAVMSYTGDTGPCDGLQLAARDADLLVTEATLGHPGEDDPRRGHMTLDEALEAGRRAGARKMLITHYPSKLRARMTEAVRGCEPPAIVARPGLRVAVPAPRAASRSRT